MTLKEHNSWVWIYQRYPVLTGKLWGCLHECFGEKFTVLYWDEIDGLGQKRCNSIANALELHLSCTNPSKWYRLHFTLCMYYSNSIAPYQVILAVCDMCPNASTLRHQLPNPYRIILSNFVLARILVLGELSEDFELMTLQKSCYVCVIQGP